MNNLFIGGFSSIHGESKICVMVIVEEKLTCQVDKAKYNYNNKAEGKLCTTFGNTICVFPSDLTPGE